MGAGDNTNAAPVLTKPADQSGEVEQAAVLQLQASDADDDALTYAVAGLPPGLTLTPGTGQIAGMPTTAGSYAVTATVSDGSLSDTKTLTWTIAAKEGSGGTNAAPVLKKPGGQRTDVGQFVERWLKATDPDGDPITYSAVGLPPGLTVEAASGRIFGAPTTPGEYRVTATASDGALSSTVSFGWNITGTAVNAPPVLAAPGDRSDVTGASVLVQLVATDPDGDVLTYAASGLPPGVTLTPSTGRIAGSPATPGSYSVTVSVTDGTLSVTASFVWTVVAANVAPVLTQPVNQSGFVGVAVVLQLQASDADGDVLTYSVSGLPPGLAATVSTGRISGTPTGAGTYTVTATASDGVLSASQTFGWTVASPNVAPVLSAPGSQTVRIGEAADLQLHATDADDDPLTYAVSGLPPGLVLSGSTGRIAGTPTVAGTYTVTAAVSDGSLSASQTFTWTVATNAAPVLRKPGGQRTSVGKFVERWFKATDPDGDPLVYSATDLPPGLVVDPVSGRVWGTPTTAGNYKVTATVTDGLLSSTVSFPWNIN